MSLANNIIAAWLPKRSGTGALHTDVGPTQTHLQWVSPSTERWRATEAGWTPRFTAASDYLQSGRVPADVSQSPWCVVHWVQMLALGPTYGNSIDCNFGAINVGPRLEIQNSKVWVYSPGSGSVVMSAGSIAPYGVWGLYGISHDGVQTARIWNNGVATGATGTGAFLGTFRSVTLGVGFNTGRPVNALIGGTVILSRQLTDKEWRQAYNAGPACEWVYRKKRRVYSIPGPAFQAAWATRATTIAGVLR
jgi:hypothetical protein